MRQRLLPSPVLALAAAAGTVLLAGCTSTASTSCGAGISATTSNAASATAATAIRARFKDIEGSDPWVECLTGASWLHSRVFSTAIKSSARMRRATSSPDSSEAASAAATA